MKKFGISSLLWLCAVVAAADPVSATSPQSYALGGNTSFDGWNALTKSRVGYGSFPGFAAWPGSVASNVQGSGDATLSKVSNGSVGGAYMSESGIFFGARNAPPNTFAGTVRISDLTPLSGLKTLVFQIETEQAYGYDLYNNTGPTLIINGTSSIQANYAQISKQAASGYLYNGQPEYVNLHAFQWDLSTAPSSITSLAIEWSQVQQSQLFAMQLNGSTQLHTENILTTAVTPEPGTLAILGSLAVLTLRKRRA